MIQQRTQSRKRLAFIALLLIVSSVLFFAGWMPVSSSHAQASVGKAKSVSSVKAKAVKPGSTKRSNKPQPVRASASKRQEGQRDIQIAGAFTPVSLDTEEEDEEIDPALSPRQTPAVVRETIGLKAMALPIGSGGTTTFFFHVFLLEARGRGPMKVITTRKAHASWEYIENGRPVAWPSGGASVEVTTAGEVYLFAIPKPSNVPDGVKSRQTYLFVVESNRDNETTFASTTVRVK